MAGCCAGSLWKSVQGWASALLLAREGPEGCMQGLSSDRLFLSDGWNATRDLSGNDAALDESDDLGQTYEWRLRHLGPNQHAVIGESLRSAIEQN